MNKTELVAAVAAKAELSKKDAEAAVAATFDAITAALATHKQRLRLKFLHQRLQASRQARHLRTQLTLNYLQ